MSELKVFFTDGQVWFGSWRNVTITLWQADPSVDTIKKSREHTLSVIKEYPRGIVVFSITPQQGRMAKIGAEQRKLLSEYFIEFKKETQAMVSVIEGSGFWLSAARAVLTGVTLLSPTPTKIFDTTDGGVSWLLDSGHVPRQTSAFREATAEARALWEQARQAK